MKESEPMLIGARLRQLREQKQMSQGDIEERTGLLRCYVSRVENGHTVPSLETQNALLGFSMSRYISSFSLEKRLHQPRTFRRGRPWKK